MTITDSAKVTDTTVSNIRSSFPQIASPLTRVFLIITRWRSVKKSTGNKAKKCQKKTKYVWLLTLLKQIMCHLLGKCRDKHGSY